MIMICVHKQMTLSVLCAFICVCIRLASSEDVLGCGGFIKSDVEINFSDVVVKLYTKHGALKDQIDCAPNNGYYFLPLYDKGEYVLKIEPPSGWLFEPNEVLLNVDGSTDPCSQGKDINFNFLGFAIMGKVVSAGTPGGPKDVKVSLSVDGKSQSLHEVSTVEGGKFIFSPVLPGKYVITASHPQLKFTKHQTVVQVGRKNAEIPLNELVVSGYDVYGTVTSNDEPIRGVSFVLFKNDDKPFPSKLEGCSTTPLVGFKTSKNSLCHVISDERGTFRFHALPPGKYKVVPHYESPTNIHFDVRPEQEEFEVTHGSFVIESPFKVTGFSVKGRILMKQNGLGIIGATLLLDGQVKCRTTANGEYHLENMQPGTYSLRVEADDVLFSTEDLKITANTPQLPDIYPVAYKVCGVVKPYRLGQSHEDIFPLMVLFTIKDGQEIEASVEAGSGKFCRFLERGDYKVFIRVLKEDEKKGLQFSPAVKMVKVLDSPILEGIEFSQLKVKLSGKVLCIPVGGSTSCPEIKVSLQRMSGVEIGKTSVLNSVTKGGVYTFENILPGTYTVSIHKNEWCWESTNLIVDVSSSESFIKNFVQTGFVVNFISSHSTEVQYEFQSSQNAPQTTKTLFLEKDHTKECVPTPGIYKFKPVSCHDFGQPVFQWNSASASTPLRLTAVLHTVSGYVVTRENVKDLFINVIKAENENSRSRLGPLTPNKLSEGLLLYEFKIQLRAGETVTLEPSASNLLFRPSKIVFEGIDDCVDDQIKFEADLGKIIEGKVIPALSGVTISVYGDVAKEKLIASTETKEDGTYKFGPLPETVKYQVFAEKEGYVMSQQNSDVDFHAHKLAEIIVEVMDKADEKHLQGVLLSLSGGESFRRNSQTGNDGKMTFSSLSPSDYFLRPMLKEYSFEPVSKIITVREGETTSVKLVGHRVAYSAYGTVTSLGGDPEKAIIVEAVGLNNCSLFQEESTTEINGHFRIRGLKPNCEYHVRMKYGRQVNQQVQRVTPSSVTVMASDGDVSGIKLIAINAIKQMDISVHIKTVDTEHLYTVNAKLCREDSPDMPVHIVKLEAAYGKTSLAKSSKAPFIVFPSVPLDNRGYFIQLESSLSPKSYNQTTDTVHFKANTSFKHVKLEFQPVRRHGDVNIGHCSYYVIPLLTVMFLIYYHQQKIFPVMNKFVRRALKFTKIAGPHSGRQGNNAGTRGSNIVRHNASNDHGVNDVVLVEAVSMKRKVKPRLI